MLKQGENIRCNHENGAIDVLDYGELKKRNPTVQVTEHF